MSESAQRAQQLFERNPADPEVSVLVQQALADDPSRTDMLLLLARSFHARRELDAAKRAFELVLARADDQTGPAAAQLRDIAMADRDYETALSMARRAAAASPGQWRAQLKFGYLRAITGDTAGWDIMDRAVRIAEKGRGEDAATALALRAVYFAETEAPARDQIKAAEAALSADPDNAAVAVALGWAYLLEHRLRDAQQIAERFRDRGEQAEKLHAFVQEMLGILAREDVTVDQLRQAGIIESAWRRQRDEQHGTDLASALAALWEAMPMTMQASFRPGRSPEDVAGLSPLDQTIVTWHDGQIPGGGNGWGLRMPIRFMSAQEIIDLDHAIAENPEKYPNWPDDEPWDQIMTDDAGNYLVVVAHDELVLRHRDGGDVHIADTFADWIWDRVVRFGGSDPRIPKLTRRR